jgi:hypothetical protein
MILHPCAACAAMLNASPGACPHCGALSTPTKLSRGAAAVLMGLTLVGADEPDKSNQLQAAYGVPPMDFPSPGLIVQPPPEVTPPEELVVKPPPELDGDGDGLLLSQGDCDDTNPTIFPGAKERWFDGVDSDCDGKNNR